MAYLNGSEIVFSPQVNGLLTEDAQEKIELADMTLSWLKSYIFEELYSFVNLTGYDLANTHFRFSRYEKTIYDLYTTEVTRDMNINGNPDLINVEMYSVKVVNAGGFSKCNELIQCRLGQITETNTRSFQGCTMLSRFTCKAGTTGSIYLQDCDKLSVQTLQGIIDSYADMTGQTAPTLYIGETNIAKLSEEYIEKAKQKNIILK